MAPSYGRIRRVVAAPSAMVLVCRKCSKKLHGGFGPDGDERVAKLLRRGLQRGADGKPQKKTRRADVAVIEVGCLGLCPKGAVVVLRADRPGDWLVVQRGAPLQEIGAGLDLPTAGPAGEV